MIASALTDPACMSEVGKVSKEINDNVFADQLYTFIATDQQLVTVKAFKY